MDAEGRRRGPSHRQRRRPRGWGPALAPCVGLAGNLPPGFYRGDEAGLVESPSDLLGDYGLEEAKDQVAPRVAGYGALVVADRLGGSTDCEPVGPARGL
eukprot:15471326-Alexandrium_andersonii.AAC.1